MGNLATSADKNYQSFLLNFFKPYSGFGKILPLAQFGIFLKLFFFHYHTLPYTKQRKMSICTKGKIEPQNVEYIQRGTCCFSVVFWKLSMV